MAYRPIVKSVLNSLNVKEWKNVMKGLDERLRAAGISDTDRTPCEIWTRVMGYHRPVSAFNLGKQGEHEERKFMREPEFIEESWENGTKIL